MLDISHFVSFYFAASIGVNVTCSIIVLVAGLDKRKPHMRTLLLCGVVFTCYQYSTWQVHDSANLAQGLFWLNLQTICILAALPSSLYLFLQWNRHKVPKLFSAVLIGLSFILLVINTLSDTTIWYTGNVELYQYQIFSGETVARIKGDMNPISYAYNALIFIVLFGLLYVARSAYKKGKTLLCCILIITIVLQVSTTVISISIDSEAIKFIYLGGLPFTLLNLLACISIGLSLKLKTASLKDEASERESLETMISSLATGISSTDSNQFYIDVMNELYELSHPKMLYIAIYETADGIDSIRTTYVLLDGKQIPNFTYSLSVVPQALITYDENIWIESGMRQQFPTVDLFQRTNADGYINAPLKSEEGRLEGSIIFIYDRPLRLTEAQKKALNIFTSRTASELKRNRLENQMHQMAYYDYLTGLPNLTRMHELINEQFAENVASNKQSVLFTLDIAKFNMVNQRHGFENAELALQEIGKRLQSYSTKSISIARTGGNTFSVLIHDADENAKGLLGLHFDAVSRLIQLPITVNDRTINLTCWGGAVIFPLQTDKVLEVSRCAEIALTSAKSSKNHDVALFDSNVLDQMNRKQTLERYLQQAITQNKELSAAYQPKVTANGTLTGFEALARWHSEELGFVSPFEFITVAEESGQIEKLGFWMFKTVCQQINDWGAAGFEFSGRVAINVSSYQFENENFVNDVMVILSEYNISPQQIEIEITESGLLSDLDKCIAKLRALKQEGFSIALDDFGTGYSSLSYLKDLPLDVLKIDRSFVIDLDNKKTKDLVQSIITIGKNMSLKLVAEGVEELVLIEQLEQMGCDIFQGYYFAKPMRGDEVIGWVG